MEEIKQLPEGDIEGVLSNVTYSNKVIQKIVGIAVKKSEGVVGHGGGITGIFKSEGHVTSGVIVGKIDSPKVDIELKLVVKYGVQIPKVAGEVTQNVREALKDMTGLSADKINVRIVDVVLPEEEKADQF
ncbi:MAG: Asp23/Gls24 family envelope stress response protein [Christensenellales bacterium]|jgi:uncharacterized alkaline shock family protein YloU